MKDKQDKNTSNMNDPSTVQLDVRKHVMAQIPVLCKAYLTAEGWKNTIEDHDEDNACPPYEIFCI
jgi:hypothetical protein